MNKNHFISTHIDHLCLKILRMNQICKELVTMFGCLYERGSPLTWASPGVENPHYLARPDNKNLLPYSKVNH
jgi:hypothetical protein